VTSIPGNWLVGSDLMALLTQIGSCDTFKVINLKKKYIVMKVSVKYGSSAIGKNGLVSKCQAIKCMQLIFLS